MVLESLFGLVPNSSSLADWVTEWIDLMLTFSTKVELILMAVELALVLCPFRIYVQTEGSKYCLLKMEGAFEGRLNFGEGMDYLKVEGGRMD